MKLFVDIDESGNIVDALAGNDVVPTKEHHHLFEVDESVFNELYKYKVIDGALNVKETLPIVGENVQLQTPEKEIEQLKKENEMNAMAIMELAELIMGGGV